MTPEDVVGPVLKEGERVRQGTRVHFDLPAGPFILVNGVVFVGSGYCLFHTLKAVAKLSKEVPG